jgi:hypothetical protein
LNTANLHNNYLRVPKSKLRLNQFGGSFSGPIIKDKAFFFFNYEWPERIDNVLNDTFKYRL